MGSNPIARTIQLLSPMNAVSLSTSEFLEIEDELRNKLETKIKEHSSRSYAEYTPFDWLLGVIWVDNN